MPCRRRAVMWPWSADWGLLSMYHKTYWSIVSHNKWPKEDFSFHPSFLFSSTNDRLLHRLAPTPRPVRATMQMGWITQACTDSYAANKSDVAPNSSTHLVSGGTGASFAYTNQNRQYLRKSWAPQRQQLALHRSLIFCKESSNVSTYTKAYAVIAGYGLGTAV